ncbi:MAG: hypothetical protein IK100_04710 [Muribaculaceae bacterium]|nr:hypothetical protein [Muribaculaceae bacterium]
MCCKELLIKRLPELDKMTLQQVAQYLDANLEHEVIECVNWPEKFPYKPFCSFVVAVSLTRLYVFFSVISKDLRAVHTSDLSPVAEDSCVEFFLQVPGSNEYWNFELNCIGTLNASHREERPSPTRLTPAELESIGRYSSCGSEAIEEQDGTFCWDLVVSIPLQLVGLDGDILPDFVMGNFYKCGSNTMHPHYVSWSAIDGEKPDFHRPDCFGKLWFRMPEPAVETQSKQQPHEPKGLKRLLHKLFGKYYS